ncbi:MAG: CRTAC1 family protein [Bryobacteraceae bacterium]
MDRRNFLATLLGYGLLPRMPGEIPAPSFVDVTAQSGVKFHCSASHTSQKYLIESMVGGVAIFDSTGDGNLDLFFVNGAALQDPMQAGKMPDKSDPRYWNRLYRNNGDGTFTDVTEKAGVRGHSYGMGVATGDYDNDGHQDIYVTNYGRNILYHNNGDGTFTDVTEKAGVGAGGWSASACFVDYDRDGKLDLIVSRYVEWDIRKNPWCGDQSKNFRAYCHPDVFKPAAHILYRNNGNGTFTDVSGKAGFSKLPGAGLGIAVNDFDLDGWPDILIANDARPQQLFRNNRDSTFSEIGVRTGLAYDEDGKTYSGMGVSFEDYDNDGRPDVFIDNLSNQRYALYRNSSGFFDYTTNSSGVGAITTLHSGWGAQFIDYDNDGWKDLFVAQGHVMDNIELTQPALRYREPLLLMRNANGRFQDVSAQSGAPFRIPLAARGAAFGDLNNDGFIDVAINCNDGDAMILRNEGNSRGNANRWLTVDTVGTTSNRDGIGARVHIVGESGLHQYGMVGTGGSYMSSGDKRVHFGLGRDATVALLEITWPSGTVQRLEKIPSNRIVKIRETERK